MLAFGLHPVAAATLQVGPGQTYAMPSAAAAVAQDGDTVAIAPGEYFDCAIWHARHLTVAGTGPGVVITDQACEGKAAFVVKADGAVLRNLTFTRIRVPDGNGAGVRGEGRDLTVEGSRFVNDQFGILAAGGGFLRVADCSFTAGGGSAGGRPTHAILADGLDLLRVERSTFAAARGGNHIAASGARTELAGNTFAAAGTAAGPLVSITGGALLLEGNTVDLEAAADRPGAVLVTGAATEIVLRGNTLRGGGGTALLRNWTGAAAAASDNTLPPGVAAVSDAGATWHRFRAWLAALRDWLHGGVALARHLAGSVLRLV